MEYNAPEILTGYTDVIELRELAKVLRETA
jgi:hypothetical protein